MFNSVNRHEVFAFQDIKEDLRKYCASKLEDELSLMQISCRSHHIRMDFVCFRHFGCAGQVELRFRQENQCPSQRVLCLQKNLLCPGSEGCACYVPEPEISIVREHKSDCGFHVHHFLYQNKVGSFLSVAFLLAEYLSEIR